MKKPKIRFIDRNEKAIAEVDTFTLTELPSKDGMSVYRVYDETGDVMDTFEELSTKEEMAQDSYKHSIEDTYAYSVFLDVVDAGYSNWYNDEWWDRYTNDNYTYKLTTPKPKTPEEIEAEKRAEEELLESLCKTDTIVFHMEDSSTDMLFNMYEGRGWDVYRGSGWGVSKDFLNELIKRHDRVICLGHGSPYGLIGGTIGKDQVPYLKEKKVVALWCYAATFFKTNGFAGHGVLCSDNAPSEVWECKSACNATVSAEWIKENITFWSACISDYLDLAWDNPDEACRLAKEKYYTSYADCTTDDERTVVDFLTNTIQVV